MDSTHNDARIAAAARQPSTMTDEIRSAAHQLRYVFPDLFSWYADLTDLLGREPSDATTAELQRLVRNAGIVGEAVTKARAHTRDASRLSQQRFPVREEVDPPRAD